ncbi:MAG: 50S ribosomal protein L18 [Candidatus Moranbacteria bacterium]|nr:50S ribosomal protein L18 [Candidatus Moranbacteria bacterium]
MSRNLLQNLKNSARLRRKRRVRSRIFGTSERPRLSVNRSLSQMSVQVIDDSRGVTLVASSTKGLSSKSQNPLELASLLGKDVAEKCLAHDVKTVVFDRSGYLYHGRVKSLADGAREAGLIF